MKRSLSLLLACVALVACERQAELEPCNIAKPECQRDVFYAVMRLRGDGWDPFQGVPPIRTVSVDDYRKQLEDQADAGTQMPDAGAADAGTPDASPLPAIDPWDVTLQLLSLVTSNTSVTQAGIDDSVNQVAAFYAASEQNVTVVDRQDETDRKNDTALLAHEFVHAFQDREHLLNPRTTTIDGSFGDQALIEGEATLYQYLVRVELDGNAPQQIDWRSFYHRDWGDVQRAQLATAESPYYAVTRWFVYPFGGDLMTRAWLRGGNAAVRRLHDEVPRHAREFMARYSDKKSTSEIAFTCKTKTPSKAYEFYARNRMGAMQVFALMSVQGAPEPVAWKTGLAWRGDEIWLYFDADGRKVAFSWRLRFADGSDADTLVATLHDHELANAIAAAKGNPIVPWRLDYSRESDDVRIVGSDDLDVLASWKGAADCGQ